VAIVPTGDELVEPGTMPGPGQIRNSNATMLAALATQAGASVRILPIAPDEPTVLKPRLFEALDADLVLVTGGVSAGRLDLVPEALERLGVSRVFHKVRVKPGKPIWFGVGPARDNASRPLVFGLPGNPVSGLVGFVLFVRPAIDALSAREGPFDRTIEATLAKPFTHSGDRPTYHPACRRDGKDRIPEVEPLDWAGSADLRGMAGSDGFAVFPAGDQEYPAGEIVRFLPLG
jgi:molybdopterin molybdotransferase